jgi:hypothetical protein
MFLAFNVQLLWCVLVVDYLDMAEAHKVQLQTHFLCLDKWGRP